MKPYPSTLHTVSGVPFNSFEDETSPYPTTTQYPPPRLSIPLRMKQGGYYVVPVIKWNLSIPLRMKLISYAMKGLKPWYKLSIPLRMKRVTVGKTHVVKKVTAFNSFEDETILLRREL